MAWTESHDDIWDHFKTDKMVEALKPIYEGLSPEETRVMVVGHLHSLWHFVLRNAWRDANLEKWGDAGIERAARWNRKPGSLVGALREAGFIDGSIAHGWIERAGKLIRDRLYNETKRHDGIKRRNYAVKRRKAAATLPYPTLPNLTLPNPTVQYDSRRKIPPTLAMVQEFCAKTKSPINPQHFMDYNEARGWMMGKSKMKDWQATIRTWEKNQRGGNNGANRSGVQGRVVGAAAPTPGKYDAIDGR